MSSSDDKIIYLGGKRQPLPDPSETDAEALQMMQDCLSMVSDKVDADQVDGLIMITFNKDNTSEDYLVGRLNMAEVSHVLNVLQVQNALLTQVDFKEMD